MHISDNNGLKPIDLIENADLKGQVISFSSKYEKLYAKLDIDSSNMNSDSINEDNDISITEETRREFFESRTISESPIFNQIPNSLEENKVNLDLIKGENSLK